MSCAAGSSVLHPGAPAAPLEPSGAAEAAGDSPEEGESGGPSAAPPGADEGRRGGSESGRAEAGAGTGDQPETRSVCSSESGSGSNPGGAGPICKICFQGPEQGELLNPCRCDGSVRYTHQLCLLKWISERGSWTCELCCYRYHVIAIKMKKPCQ
ncbi:E3 ubiquitin-protein ligase MARCH11-like, partial [Apteryx rowi]